MLRHLISLPLLKCLLYLISCYKFPWLFQQNFPPKPASNCSKSLVNIKICPKHKTNMPTNTQIWKGHFVNYSIRSFSLFLPVILFCFGKMFFNILLESCWLLNSAVSSLFLFSRKCNQKVILLCCLPLTDSQKSEC